MRLMLRAAGLLLAASSLFAAGKIQRSIDFEDRDLSAWSFPSAADFDLRIKVRRAGKSMMVTFGYQDTLHFYYAHVSADNGDHRVHNGLFKVDGGERFRIAGQGSSPALPDQNWHRIRIVREVSTGKIEVFVDDDSQPRFRHVDTSFRFGRVGLGSFNETGDFDDFRLEGEPSSACR